MGLVAYILGEESGIARTIDEKLSPVEIAMTEEKTTSIIETVYLVSLLDDPEGKEIKILEPPLKKVYLDRMTYVGRSELVFLGNVTDILLNNVLTELATKVGANVVIIDNRDSQRIIITE